MPLVASTVLGVGSGIGKIFQGASDVKKAKKELATLEKPFYDIQEEYYQNRNLAGQAAQSGMPAATRDYLTTEGQRGLSSTFGAMNQTGGNPNDYARVLDVYNQSINKTAAQDAAAQLENIRYFMNVNKDLAGQKTTQWGVNEYQPYQNKLKELTQRMAAGKQNIWGGIDQSIGALSAFGTAKSNEGMYKKMFGDGNTISDPNIAQQDWLDWKAQQERNNAAQGDNVLSPKFSAEKPKGDFYVPPELGLTTEQEQGLYNYLNRGR